MNVKNLLGILLLFLPICLFAQNAKKADTIKNNPKDTTVLNGRILNLVGAKSNVDSISAVKSKLEQSQDSIARSISLLQNKQKKSENDYAILTRLIQKKQKNLDKLNETTADLKEKSTAYRDTLENIKLDIKKLETDRDKYKKDTAYLNKTVSSLKLTSDSVQKEIVTRQAIISKQLDSLEVIAIIEMNDFIHIHKLGAKKGFLTRVQSVHLLVKEGMILEIVAVTDSGTFRNKSSVIDLLHFGSRGADKLRYEKQKYRKDADSLYVYLDDVIKYSPIRSYSDLPYSDFDITLTPTTGNRTYLLRESTSINTYFNVSAYTDIKGIDGDPNGIAQFAGDARFITNTRNFKNSSFVYLNYISFIGGLSKYDSKFKGTEVIHHDSVSRRDLFQRSTYSIGVKMNLLRGFASPYPHHLFNDIQLNIGYNFVGSRVIDTAFKDVAKTIIDTTFRTVTQNQLYIEPIVTLNRHKNFSLSLSIPFHMISIKESEKLKNITKEYWASPSIDLMYYGKRDTGSKLFFRYRHYINLSDKSQAFSQIQLGYSVNLTNVWSGK